MAKVLVTDWLAPQGFEILKQTPGLEVVDAPGHEARRSCSRRSPTPTR